MGAQVAHVPPRSLTRPTRPSYDHQHNVLLPPRSRPHTFALARARALHHTPHDQNHTYADRATTAPRAGEYATIRTRQHDKRTPVMQLTIIANRANQLADQQINNLLAGKR